MRHSVKRLHKSEAKNCSIQGQGQTFSATMSQNLLPNLRTLPREMQRVLDYLKASRDTSKSILA